MRSAGRLHERATSAEASVTCPPLKVGNRLVPGCPRRQRRRPWHTRGMRDFDLVAKWFEDIGSGLRRRIAALDADALEWRADERGNNVRETVWHIARWCDVLERFL